MRGDVPALGAVPAHGRDRAAVGAEEALRARLAGLRQREGVGLALVQRAEQGAAGLRGVGEPPGGDAELHGPYRIGEAQALGDGGGAAGLGAAVLGVGGAVLLPGERAGDQGEDEQRHQRGEQPAEPAPLAAAGGGAGGEERGLAAGQLPRPVGEQLLGLRQPAAPVERAGVAVQLLPAVRGLGEPAQGAHPLAVLLDPAVQPGPGGEQRLVREVDDVVVEGEQAGRDEPFEHVPDVGGGGGAGAVVRRARCGGPAAGGRPGGVAGAGRRGRRSGGVPRPRPFPKPGGSAPGAPGRAAGPRARGAGLVRRTLPTSGTLPTAGGAAPAPAPTRTAGGTRTRFGSRVRTACGRGRPAAGQPTSAAPAGAGVRGDLGQLRAGRRAAGVLGALAG